MRWMLSKKFWIAVLIVAAVLVGYVAYMALSPPGHETTVDEGERPKPGPQPAPPASPLAPLRQTWDSEAVADWPVATLLASLSDKAYLTPVEAESSFAALGFTRVKTFAENSMLGYVVSEGDVTVVVFRGTNQSESADWIVNLNCAAVTTAHGAIHQGFHSAYQSLKPQVLALIKQGNPKHLWITGHSLGGALALVCAYDLIENEKLAVDGLITFGQPMVAGSRLAQRLDGTLLGRYAHYVNDADIVARIPPGYAHCGSLVWFTKGGVRRSKPKAAGMAETTTKGISLEDDEEIPPLSPQEFESLKADLKESPDVKINRLPDRRPGEKSLVQGALIWIQDHLMSVYLEKIFKSNGGS